jgi:hypothetical protein
MSITGAAPRCGHCGQPPHPGVCPMVKAIEYHENGTIKRVEYKSASDYVAPFMPAPYAPPNPPLPPNPYPWPVTWSIGNTPTYGPDN